MRFEETGPLRFVWALNRAKRQYMLTQHSLAEFNAMRCYLSQSERTGFAIKQDGELTCLFSNEGAGIEAALEATILGARKLSCFDVELERKLLTLPEFYKSLGWVEVGRERFRPDLVPHNWPSAHGSPDVVFMVFGDCGYDHGARS